MTASPTANGSVGHVIELVLVVHLLTKGGGKSQRRHKVKEEKAVRRAVEGQGKAVRRR